MDTRDIPSTRSGTEDPKRVGFTYRNVQKKLDSMVYQSVVDTIDKWDFFPYPLCTRQQLEEVDLYMVAYRNREDTLTAANTAKETEAAIETAMEVHNPAEEIVGVVGVVWVPLTPGEHLEGYIQVVLVEPQFRKCRIARHLLERTLKMREGGDPRRQILRWRLHTMSPSQNTTQYLRSLLNSSFTRKNITSGEKEEEEEEEKEEKKQQMDQVEELLAAVPRVYESFGFTVRRYVYNYYERSADAMEMVKCVEGVRKRR
ncbi:uncharacterized protein TM35_000073640 [Trypanosoma theileri]|uniref:N-acetyltransferase domain-containing protein n=1 Tax=Trypanosoma theileri TaxID=67003 RepID=A0A1X0P3D9_9TRYP|nr:uncharacterized protein TM35_000073640 [Trypanosoma theileri]ORC90940.1 hypothetical protein TM35_000073640 [Trypanosoma theileri]